MAKVLVKEEYSRDITGIIVRTATYQDIEDITPDADARSWRQEHVDAVYTTVEESVYEQGAPVWAADATVQSEPLETNHYFAPMEQAVRENWLRWKKNPNDPNFQPTNTQPDVSSTKPWKPELEGEEYFAWLYSLIQRGQEMYFAPRMMVRMTILEDDPPNAERLGLVDQPEQHGFTGTVPVGVDFLLSAARGQQEGNKWRNTYEWMGSAPGGWDQTIYNPGV
jgi:hypothetical protein